MFADCREYCNNDRAYVCGSGGKTYRNDCSLRNAACLNPHLKIVKHCEGRCPCPKHKGKARNTGLEMADAYYDTTGLFDDGPSFERKQDDVGLLNDDTEIQNPGKLIDIILILYTIQ